MQPARNTHELGGETASPEWPGWPGEECLREALRSGCETAYAALLERFQAPVFHLVQRLIDDPNDAGDVTQDVFFKVFRNVGSFRGQSSLKTWVYRIAVNEAYNRRRWFGRHRRAEVGLQPEEDGRDYLDSIGDPARSPYDLTLNEEWKSAIGKALAGLNPVFRSAVVLRDLEELSYEEIAGVLDVSLGTVKSRILRGRESLRKALVEQMEPARGYGFNPQPAGD
ncbi:MAG: sigma-70 family RNA polymerase sigma factor [Candidatus Solibacter usitatus]|nr:sigma-70 family RNA polymerase sigma factor [Candidatus Solibacter usitatus]